jgi:hypothetical protein
MPDDRPLPVSLRRHCPWKRAATLATLALASSVALAQGSVTLYGGARSGGEFIDQNKDDAVVKLDSGAAGSVSFDWFLSDGRPAQVFYSYQRSALPGAGPNGADVPVNISYLHVGGRAFFDGVTATRGGYLVGGLGISYLSPGLDGLSSEIRPSMNLGVGYEWALSKQVSLRGELRSYLTVASSSGGFFCSGGCVVAIRADTVAQFEAMLGLSFAF